MGFQSTLLAYYPFCSKSFLKTICLTYSIRQFMCKYFFKNYLFNKILCLVATGFFDSALACNCTLYSAW